MKRTFYKLSDSSSGAVKTTDDSLQTPVYWLQSGLNNRHAHYMFSYETYRKFRNGVLYLVSLCGLFALGLLA